MAANYNDGTVKYGSRTIASVTGMKTYVCRSITVRRPEERIEDVDEIGEPQGSVGVPGFVSGSAVLQLSNASADPPDAGDTFTTTFDSGIGAETFYFGSVEATEEQKAQKLCTVEFHKKYN